jgi:hypothetical protein
MSFLLMTGLVLNTLDMPARTDRKTGEMREAYKQVQLQCQEPLQDGQERFSVQTLSVDDLAPYDALKGSWCAMDVGVYVKGAGIGFYGKRGAQPRRMAPPSDAGASKPLPAARGGGVA